MKDKSNDMTLRKKAREGTRQFSLGEQGVGWWQSFLCGSALGSGVDLGVEPSACAISGSPGCS